MPQHCYKQFDPLFSRLLDSFHDSNGATVQVNKHRNRSASHVLRSWAALTSAKPASFQKWLFQAVYEKETATATTRLRETLICLSKRLIERIVLPIKCMLYHSVPQCRYTLIALKDPIALCQIVGRDKNRLLLKIFLTTVLTS
jgi:hypothetical protein